MPKTSPGQCCYEAYRQSPGIASRRGILWPYLRPEQRAAWEAAAQAVLEADSDGRHTTTACFRFGLGDVLRLAGSPCPWTVRSRRWVERAVMPPYAEYHLQSPDDLLCWQVEADLEPWEAEDRLTLDLDPDVRREDARDA